MPTEVEAATEEVARSVEKLGTWQEDVPTVGEISSKVRVNLLPVVRLQLSILYQPSVRRRGQHLLGDSHR